MDKITIYFDISIPSNNHLFVIPQLGDKTLNFPSSKLPFILSFAFFLIRPMVRNQLCLAFGESTSKGTRIIGFVYYQTLWLLSWSTTIFWWNFNSIKSIFSQYDFMWRHRANGYAQKNTRSLYHRKFGIFTALSFTGIFASFFASSSAKNALYIFTSSSHIFKRFQQVRIPSFPATFSINILFYNFTSYESISTTS